MRTFKEFPKESICPICGTNENKECVLVGIHGTQEDRIMEAKPYHLECIDLVEVNNENSKMLIQIVRQ